MHNFFSVLATPLFDTQRRNVDLIFKKNHGSRCVCVGCGGVGGGGGGGVVNL